MPDICTSCGSGNKSKAVSDKSSCHRAVIKVGVSTLSSATMGVYIASLGNLNAHSDDVCSQNRPVFLPSSWPAAPPPFFFSGSWKLHAIYSVLYLCLPDRLDIAVLLGFSRPCKLNPSYATVTPTDALGPDEPECRTCRLKDEGI